MGSFVTNVHYLDHSSDAPIVRTDVTTTDISNLGVLFKDSDTSYVGLDVHTFNYGVFVSKSPIDPETYISKPDDLIYFNGKFVSGGYSTLYNGNKVYAFYDRRRKRRKRRKTYQRDHNHRYGDSYFNRFVDFIWVCRICQIDIVFWFIFHHDRETIGISFSRFLWSVLFHLLVCE